MTLNGIKSISNLNSAIEMNEIIFEILHKDFPLHNFNLNCSRAQNEHNNNQTKCSGCLVWSMASEYRINLTPN